MLVLTRREGQGILIGEDIFVHLIRSNDGEVRVGIDAPRSVNVVRMELLDDSSKPRAQRKKK